MLLIFFASNLFREKFHHRYACLRDPNIPKKDFIYNKKELAGVQVDGK